MIAVRAADTTLLSGSVARPVITTSAQPDPRGGITGPSGASSMQDDHRREDPMARRTAGARP
ncbi:MAG: hypothetical protein QOK35_3047 [Pseudonocardiales bacterium]|nr:hypothetical protein [Pseudonocardiales bacterium]